MSNTLMDAQRLWEIVCQLYKYVRNDYTSRYFPIFYYSNVHTTPWLFTFRFQATGHDW